MSTPNAAPLDQTGGTSLLVKVSLVIVVTVCIILTGFGAFNYFSKKGEMEASLMQRGNNVAARLAQNLIVPLWDFDTDAGETAFQSEMGEQALYAAIVFDDNDKIFTAMARNDAWEPQVIKQSPPAEGYILIEREVVREEKVIGTLRLLFTPKLMHKALSNTLMGIAVQAVGTSVVIILVILFFIRSLVIRPLVLLQEYAASVEEGDLECRLASGKFTGELVRLKQSVESMVCAISERMQEVEEKKSEAEEKTRHANESAEKTREALAAAERARSEGMLDAAHSLEDIVKRVHSSSSMLSGQVDDVSDGARRQAEQVDDTATAMEEMNATVLEVAKNASHTSVQAQETKDRATEGSDIVRRTDEVIKQVEFQSERLTENMASLGERADNIGQILSVITDIADQTNLLALNAAIEAARAGEAGRGFAVVADEVRKLAEKTMQATKQVDEAIRAIQTDTGHSLSITKETVAVVSQASELSKASGEALESILALVDNTSDQVASIATAAEQQSATSEEINRRIEEINLITAQTSEGMASSAQAVSEIVDLIGDLNGLIESLKTDNRNNQE